MTLNKDVNTARNVIGKQGEIEGMEGGGGWGILRPSTYSVCRSAAQEKYERAGGCLTATGR